MKHRPEPAAMCAGKTAFAAFSLATEAARRANRNKDARREAYHCVHCHAWHVGTSRAPRCDRNKLRLQHRRQHDSELLAAAGA
jgi:hypothetical protein